MGKTLGLLLTGQAPWPEVVAAVASFVEPDVDVIQTGALDGCSREEIRRLEPASPRRAIKVRLRDGTPVRVDAEGLGPRLQEGLDRLLRWGADAVVLLSCAQLPPLRSARLLVEPWRLLPPVVAGLLPRGRLTVVIPRPASSECYRAKWEPFAGRVSFVEAEPYGAGESWLELGQGLRGAELVVLDSMAFPRDAREELQRVQRAPVLLPLSLVCSLAAQLL